MQCQILCTHGCIIPRSSSLNGSKADIYIYIGMLAHTYLDLFFYSEITAKRFSEGRKWCATESDKYICHLAVDSGKLFLNVTVTLKVCPRSAAPEQDGGRLTAVSNTHRKAQTQAHIMSICHPDSSKEAEPLNSYWKR